MADPTRALTADAERAAGKQRLQAAVADRRLAQKQASGAKGTPAEIEAAAATRAADQTVTARERWLEWVDRRDQE